jgi:hypothetical protein
MRRPSAHTSILLIIYLVQVRNYAAALCCAIGLKVNGLKNRWTESPRCLPRSTTLSPATEPSTGLVPTLDLAQHSHPSR